jgi:hypothetical protein
MTLLRKAKKNAEHALRHKEALVRQRDWIKTEVVAKLSPDQLMVQMDFVCTQTSSYRPIHTLVLAIHSKPKDSGPYKQFVIAT